MYHRTSRRDRAAQDELAYGGEPTRPDIRPGRAAFIPAPVSFPAAEAARPSRRPAAAPVADRTGVRAVVKWFDPGKGFGFAATDGEDVFLHGTVVRAAGHELLLPGAVLLVDTARSDRGAKALVIHSMTPPPPVAPTGTVMSLRAPAPPSPVGSVVATVKWFDTARGFGFVAPDGGAADLFIHASALERSGIAELQAGQQIRAEVSLGRQGKPEVARFRLV